MDTDIRTTKLPHLPTLNKYLFCFFLLFISQAAISAESEDWPLYGRDYNNQRFSPLKQIDSSNIQHLKLAWRYATGKVGTFQTSPIVINGIMYLTTPFNDVIALNAKSGAEIWRYKHKLKSKNYCCGPANRGPAVANGKVYTVTIDARLIALDQTTGELLWE